MTADASAPAQSGSAPITLAAMTLSASMILVDQTAVPLATADVIDDLGGAVADGQWILTANTLPLAARWGSWPAARRSSPRWDRCSAAFSPASTGGSSF